MPTILTHVPVSDGTPNRTALEALTRARQIAAENGWTCAASVFAPDAAAAAETLGRYGAETVYAVSDDAFAQPLGGLVVDALATVIREAAPEIVVMPSTEGMKDALGGLAQRLGAPALPDVVAFSASDTAVEATRPVMAAKFRATDNIQIFYEWININNAKYYAFNNFGGQRNLYQFEEYNWTMKGGVRVTF